MSTLELSQMVPDFTLPSTAGGTFQLSSVRGSRAVVILFFPLAWSSVCTKELCSVRDDFARYRDLDALVVGISIDSVFALGAWAKEQTFDFPLLSDFNREVIELYDVVDPDLFGQKRVARRSVFVIDREGRLKHREVCASAGDLPDFAAVHAALG